MAARTVEDNLRAFDDAKSERSNWDVLWQSVADLVLPTRQFTTKRSPGEQRNNLIFNSTPTQSLSDMAAAVHGTLTNPRLRWMQLALMDDDVSDEESQTWLYDCSTLMLEYFASTNSGFPLASHEIYLDLGAFGTAICQATESPTTGMFRFKARPLQNIYIRENDEGEITEVYRFFEPRAKELTTMFPGGNLSARTKEMIKDPKRCYERVEMVQCIYLRSEYDPSKRNALNKRFASRYIEVQQKQLVQEGGFGRNPFLAPRWEKATDEAYGRSPAINMLPFIKGVNAREKTQMMAEEKAVNPPLSVPANGMEGPIRTAPGAINYRKAGSAADVTPLFTQGDVRHGREAITLIEQTIKNAFYLDVMNLVENDRMTAEEVITRREQGLIRFSPVLSRVESEWITPAVMLVFDWIVPKMIRSGRLRQPPQSLQGQQLKPTYKGPLALAQRHSEAQNFTNAMTTATPLFSVDPTVGLNIDPDMALRTIFSMHNADPRFLRTKAQVTSLRRQQLEAQSMASNAAIAKDGAAAVRDAAAGAKDLSVAAPGMI